MATTTANKPKDNSALDDSAAAPAPSSLEEFIDVPSLQKEVDRAAKRNRDVMAPYRRYQKRCIEAAGVPNTHQVRQLTSNICGAVARLSMVPDDTEKVLDDQTEFELQVIKTAELAEKQLDSEAVMTVTARKLSRAALVLRKADPDGTKGVAWVNDTLEDEAGVLDR